MKDHPDSIYDIFTLRAKRTQWDKLLQLSKKKGFSRTFVLNAFIDSFVAGKLTVYEGRIIDPASEGSVREMTQAVLPKPKPYFKNFKSHLLVTDHLSEEEKDRLREVGIIKDPDNPDSFEYKVAHQDELIAQGKLPVAAPPALSMVQQAPLRAPTREPETPQSAFKYHKKATLSADNFADPHNILPSEVPPELLAEFNDPKEE